MVEIVAEAGVNHNGSLDEALRLIDAAKDCGCDVVKFQIFESAVLEPRGARRDMLQALELGREGFARLKAHADACGIEFMATPFDTDSLEFLAVDLNVKRIKIGSADLQNEILVEAAMNTGLDVILSTGMASWVEIWSAIHDSYTFGGLTLLHCTSAYPCPVDQVNLRAIPAMAQRFHVPVGFSDHTEGINVAISAVAFGAVMIEKHFTLNRELPGPDHKASIEPWEMMALVLGAHEVERALGDGEKRLMPAEAEVVDIAEARRAHRDSR